MTGTTRIQVAQNGAAIRAIRQREGLTVDQLASKVSASLSLSAPHLRNIENEHRSASPEHLALIARHLNVPIAALRRVEPDRDVA